MGATNCFVGCLTAPFTAEITEFDLASCRVFVAILGFGGGDRDLDLSSCRRVPSLDLGAGCGERDLDLLCGVRAPSLDLIIGRGDLDLLSCCRAPNLDFIVDGGERDLELLSGFLVTSLDFITGERDLDLELLSCLRVPSLNLTPALSLCFSVTDFKCDWKHFI